MLRLVLTETPSTLNPGQDFSADVQHCSTAEWLKKKKKKKKLTGWFSCVQKSYNPIPVQSESALSSHRQSVLSVEYTAVYFTFYLCTFLWQLGRAVGHGEERLMYWGAADRKVIGQKYRTVRSGRVKKEVVSS